MSIPDSGEYLKSIIDTVNDGLVVIGPDGRILMVNPALERLTGWSKDDLVGKPCSVLRCDVCEVSRRKGKDHWCSLFEEKTVHRRRCTIIRKDGGCVPVLKNASILMKDGEVQAAVEILSDITDIVTRDQKIEELSRKLSTPTGFQGMIGKSEAMRRVFGIIEKAARTEAPVIIYGESGTGKERAAQAVHDLSRRSEGPFIKLNCAALNESLFESELFGHVKGAFTGAVRHRVGRFEAAHQGDLFLDEIGDIPHSIQVKLLRVLETKTIERVGDHRPIEVDVRIISATNRDLRELTQSGLFREDLLYRINVVPIQLPALRERKEDIPLLTDAFLRDAAQTQKCAVPDLMNDTLDILMEYDWPGNVRELKSAVEYAMVVAEHEAIRPEHLPQNIVELARGKDGLGSASKTPATKPGRMSAGEALVENEPAEKLELINALNRAGGNKSEAARILGVHRGTILYRMRKYGIELERKLAL